MAFRKISHLTFKNVKLEGKCDQFEELKEIEKTYHALCIKHSELKTFQVQQEKAMSEKIEWLKEAQEKLKESFKALSSEALEKSNASFLCLAKESLAKFHEGAKGDLEKRQQSIEHLITPVKETLTKLDIGMTQLEKERKGDHVSLREQMKMMTEAEKMLRKETSSLVNALRAPVVRGRWGEIQLRRVIEIAGMINHCDFYEQPVEKDPEGMLRPDLIVRLPGGKQIIVDAKTPFEGYLAALESDDQIVKEACLKRHARHVRQHVVALGKKAYWEKFQPTPEFVVLFIPSENFFSAALEYDPSLIESGAQNGVIIATPTTLIGLLRAISYGWRQEKLSQNAQEISELGAELYKRIIDMGNHFTKVGKSLSSAVESYNKTVGSLESRVMVSARKFKDLGIKKKDDLTVIEMIDRIPREIQVEEILVEKD
ncbi:MAG: DNA recombination protein RmuC [Simkaniaceae bacterium]|nr:DNA recombination protein RmuC [Simkaniaceae bacterium]